MELVFIRFVLECESKEKSKLIDFHIKKLIGAIVIASFPQIRKNVNNNEIDAANGAGVITHRSHHQSVGDNCNNNCNNRNDYHKIISFAY